MTGKFIILFIFLIHGHFLGIPSSNEAPGVKDTNVLIHASLSSDLFENIVKLWEIVDLFLFDAV